MTSTWSLDEHQFQNSIPAFLKGSTPHVGAQWVVGPVCGRENQAVSTVLLIAHVAGLSMGQEALDTAPEVPAQCHHLSMSLLSPGMRGLIPFFPAKCLPRATVGDVSACSSGTTVSTRVQLRVIES